MPGDVFVILEARTLPGASDLGVDATGFLRKWSAAGYIISRTVSLDSRDTVLYTWRASRDAADLERIDL